MDLRFKYCPNDPKERERLSASQKLGIIVELEKQIRSLVDEYGFGVEESFAQQIVNGRLASIKEVLKVAKRAEKARLN